jgi:hypothetical protein
METNQLASANLGNFEKKKCRVCGATFQGRRGQVRCRKCIDSNLTKPYRKKCITCNKIFLGKYKFTRYCSEKCKRKGRKRKKVIYQQKCVVCKRWFLPRSEDDRDRDFCYDTYCIRTQKEVDRKEILEKLLRGGSVRDAKEGRC